MMSPHSAGGPNRLRSFVVAMTELIDQPKEDEAHLLADASALLEDLICNDDWLPEAFAQPSERSYNQYLLHCDPRERFSLVSFVWGPGQSTPIHNHTVWGLIGMLRGTEVSQPYGCDNDGRLAPAGDPVKLEPGAIGKVSPLIGDIHSVANACRSRSSISIHLYGGNIGAIKRSAFELGSGAERVFVSGYANTVVPNLWHRSAASAR